MICKNCNTENPEDALFCKQCGKDLNAKNLCPACGYENADDALFCNHCGTRLNGETKTKPKREPAANAAETTGAAEAASTSNWNWRKIVELCGGILAMCGVFVVLLCTFLLGFNNIGMASDVSSSSAIGVSENIYYFFGGIYEDLSTTLDAMEAYSTMAEASLYLPVIIGTVITAGMIISVLVLSVLTAVRYGLKTAGKSDKDYSRLAIATVLTFVLGSLLLLADNAAYISYKSSSGSATMKVSLNGAGIAGIVCGLVCLGIFLACRIAQSGKELITKQSVMKLCFTTGALVLLGVIIGMAGKTGVRISQSSYYSVGTNLFAWGGALAISSYSSEPVGEYIVSFLGQCAQFALVVLAALAILYRLRHLIEQNQQSGLPLAISLAAVAAAYLVLDIVAVVLGNNYLYGESTGDSMPTIHYANVIVTFVFAVLNLVAAIVYKILAYRKKTV